jgi:Mg2+/Co2+ transporter CorB
LNSCFTGIDPTDSLTVTVLVFPMLGLIACSAFFSVAETSMMALNCYHLRHLAEQRHRGAGRARRLLDKSDGRIDLVSLGNNFRNWLVTQITT